MAFQAKERSWLKILLFGFITFALAAATLLGVYRYKVMQKDKEIQEFVSKIIDSAREDTEYYKNNSKEDVIAELQNNRNIMTHDYTASVIDYTWGVYVVHVSFNNGVKIKLDVSFRNNKPFLLHFRKL